MLSLFTSHGSDFIDGFLVSESRAQGFLCSWPTNNKKGKDFRLLQNWLLWSCKGWKFPWELKMTKNSFLSFIFGAKIQILVLFRRSPFFYVLDFYGWQHIVFLSANCECKEENIWLFSSVLVRKSSAFHWIDAEREE